jgi:hypothetical protein
MMTKIQFELSAKPSKAEKAAKGQSGFMPVAAFRGDRTLERLGGEM